MLPVHNCNNELIEYYNYKQQEFSYCFLQVQLPFCTTANRRRKTVTALIPVAIKVSSATTQTQSK